MTDPKREPGPAIGEWLNQHNLNPVDQQSWDETLAAHGDLFISGQGVGRRLRELVLMGMAQTVTTLSQRFTSLAEHDDFEVSLALGTAAMMLEDWEAASELLGRCTKQAPDQPAGFVNLAQVQLRQSLVSQSFATAEKGLQRNPNHYPLWESLAKACKAADKPWNEILSVANSLKSWMGISIFFDLTEDQAGKVSALTTLYQDGERDLHFLVDLTGLLGEMGRWQQIIEIIQATPHSLDRPWELDLHLAQAHMATHDFEAFTAEAQQLLSKPNLPEEIQHYLRDLIQQGESRA